MYSPSPDTSSGSGQLGTVASGAYYAVAPLDECVGAVIQNVEAAKIDRDRLGFGPQAVANWNAYHVRDDGAASWADGLYANGDQSEKIRLRTGLLRMLVRRAMTMITSIKPVVDPRANNTDSSTLHIVEVARSLADHYLRGKKLYSDIHKGVEHAWVLGAGFVWIDYDPFAGPKYMEATADELDGRPGLMLPQPQAEDGFEPPPAMFQTFQGDVSFRTATLFDVFWDQNAKDWKRLDWIAVRSYENRYELMARYPDQAELIRDAPTNPAPPMPYERVPMPRTTPQASDMSVAVVTWYHRKTLAVPEGRRIVYLSRDVVLEDGPLLFSRLPILRLCESEIVDSAHGFTEMNLLRPLSEMIDMIASKVATNQGAFLTPNLFIDGESNIEDSQTTGGLNIFRVPGLSESPNDPIRIPKINPTDPSAFKFFDLLRGLAVGNMGLNEVVLGNPPAGLDAGVAINLFQSMAYQAASMMERSYGEAVEDSIMLVIEALRAHPDMERTLEIVGSHKSTSIQQFYGRDLNVIDRISVDLGNPSSRTVAGRQSILESVRQTGVALSADEALGILSTGSIDQATDGISDEILLIHDEYDIIAKAKFAPAPPPQGPDGVSAIPFVQLPLPPEPGQPPAPPPPAPFLWGVPPVRAGDKHSLHIQGHRAIGANMALRTNPAVSMALDIHEGWHAKMHMQGDVILGIAEGRLPMGAGNQPPPQQQQSASAPQPQRQPPPAAPSHASPLAEALKPPALPPVHATQQGA